MSERSEYRIWSGIKERCLNSESKFYRLYGGAGVKIHPPWRHSFLRFLKDVGERPSPRHSIDRFPNNNGNYEPGNVRWATQSQQTRNLRTTKNYTFKGKTMCLTDWAVELGINLQTLSWRIHEDGQTIEQAFSSSRARKIYEVDGRKMTMAEWANECGISIQTISGRIHTYGWTMKEAVTTPLLQ